MLGGCDQQHFATRLKPVGNGEVLPNVSRYSPVEQVLPVRASEQKLHLFLLLALPSWQSQLESRKSHFRIPVFAVLRIL